MPKKMTQLEKTVGVRINARMVRGLEILTKRGEIMSDSEGVREAIKDLLKKYGVWEETRLETETK